MSLVLETDNTWKYDTLLIVAMENSLLSVNFSVGLIHSRILEIWDAYGSATSYRRILTITSVKFFQVHVANIMNVDEFTTFCSLLSPLLSVEGSYIRMRREASSDTRITWRSRE